MRDLTPDEIAAYREQKRDEKILIASDLPRPGVQLIFRRLKERAEAMAAEYDKIDVINHPQKAIYVQCYRDIVLKDIPEFFEEIMNHDKVDTAGHPLPEVKPWSFWRWLFCDLWRGKSA